MIGKNKKQYTVKEIQVSFLLQLSQGHPDPETKSPRALPIRWPGNFNNFGLPLCSATSSLGNLDQFLASLSWARRSHPQHRGKRGPCLQE